MWWHTFHLFRLRQNLREKHARHITDLRAYYEAEISALKEKLNLIDLTPHVEKSNPIVIERSEQKYHLSFIYYHLCLSFCLNSCNSISNYFHVFSLFVYYFGFIMVTVFSCCV